MYTRCLWCTADLGRNEVLESFPVGRRLAFDQAKGRLWVVCRQCERWNLTPVEERWEAIEGCERLYRETRQRVATDQIGLAKLREGLVLVRIGEPLRPEFAAWRYGDQFGRRRQRALLLGAAAGVAGAAIIAGQFVLGASTLTLYNLMNPAMALYKRSRKGATIVLPSGASAKVSLFAAEKARAQVAGDRLRVAIPKAANWRLSGEDDDNVFRARDREALGLPNLTRVAPNQWHVLDGDPARDALARVLPIVNAAGGSRRTVSESVALVEGATTGDAAAALLGKRSVTADKPLSQMETPLRLALEMAMHEADERRWLEGELAELERRWQEAEQLARIADRLLRPSSDESSAP